MADMDGQVALVTGGVRGIGAAITERLVHRGVRVAAGYSRDSAKAKDFQSKFGDRVTTHQGNIGSSEDCERVIDEVIQQHGSTCSTAGPAGSSISARSSASPGTSVRPTTRRPRRACSG